MTVEMPPIERNDVPDKYRWNSKFLFKSTQDWENAFRELNAMLMEAVEYSGRLAQGSESLIGFFKFSTRIQKLFGILHVYATMDYATNMQNQEAADRFFRARDLYSKVQTAIAFSDPEILAIGEKQISFWLKDNPELKVYAHYFDRLFSLKSHIKSSEIEEILGQVLEPFRTATTIHSTLADSDLVFRNATDQTGNEYEIAQSAINVLLAHRARDVRETAWKNYSDGYLAVKNTFAGCLAAGVKQNVFNARVRGYTSSLEAALKPHKIPTSVFHNLIDVFIQRLPVWHKYWRLRKRILGYPDLAVFDIRAPLAKEYRPIEFDQAIELICEGLKPLGDEYISNLRRGVLENGWVDSYPNREKRSGAFSSGSPGTHPYIMMSFNKDIYSLSTLAHELGHSMHSYLSWQSQPFIYAKYSLFVAEVASNLNQALVRAHLLNTIHELDFRVAILEEAMANFHRYLFIMPTLARFELAIHERIEANQSLTADYLISKMADLFEEGYGGELEFDHDRIGITWAQFPNHLYANFYVFQYATGIAGALAISRGILSGNLESADRYLSFLRTGGAKYPLDALKIAGIDLTTVQPIHEAFDIIEDTISLLENLLL
jgi:oligoendopeptidase F